MTLDSNALESLTTQLDELFLTYPSSKQTYHTHHIYVGSMRVFLNKMHTFFCALQRLVGTDPEFVLRLLQQTDANDQPVGHLITKGDIEYPNCGGIKLYFELLTSLANKYPEAVCQLLQHTNQTGLHFGCLMLKGYRDYVNFGVIKLYLELLTTLMNKNSQAVLQILLQKNAENDCHFSQLLSCCNSSRESMNLCLGLLIELREDCSNAVLQILQESAGRQHVGHVIVGNRNHAEATKEYLGLLELFIVKHPDAVLEILQRIDCNGRHIGHLMAQYQRHVSVVELYVDLLSKVMAEHSGAVLELLQKVDWNGCHLLPLIVQNQADPNVVKLYLDLFSKVMAEHSGAMLEMFKQDGLGDQIVQYQNNNMKVMKYYLEWFITRFTEHAVYSANALDIIKEITIATMRLQYQGECPSGVDIAKFTLGLLNDHVSKNSEYSAKVFKLLERVTNFIFFEKEIPKYLSDAEMMKPYLGLFITLTANHSGEVLQVLQNIRLYGWHLGHLLVQRQTNVDVVKLYLELLNELAATQSGEVLKLLQEVDHYDRHLGSLLVEYQKEALEAYMALLNSLPDQAGVFTLFVNPVDDPMKRPRIDWGGRLDSIQPSDSLLKAYHQCFFSAFLAKLARSSDSLEHYTSYPKVLQRCLEYLEPTPNTQKLLQQCLEPNTRVNQLLKMSTGIGFTTWRQCETTLMRAIKQRLNSVEAWLEFQNADAVPPVCRSEDVKTAFDKEIPQRQCFEIEGAKTLTDFAVAKRA